MSKSYLVKLLSIIKPSHRFSHYLKETLAQHPDIDIREMDFPLDWESEPLWKSRE